MNGRNEKLKATTRKADGSSDEMAAKDELAAKYRTAMDKYKHRRQEMKQLQDELDVLENSLDDVLGERDHLHSRHSAVVSKLRSLDSDTTAQEVC